MQISSNLSIFVRKPCQVARYLIRTLWQMN
nr:MAG TPA: hypothetical protein [Caudoviricetes sp.]DAQ53135.1 MAG TPA: hypothetical protein [Caudoviricetes sp.]